MTLDRYTRKTYAGKVVPRRPTYPRLLRRGRAAGHPHSAMTGFIMRGIAVFFLLAVVLIAVFAVSSYSAYAQITASLKPRLAALNNREVFETSRIYDRNGTLLYEFFDAGRRTRIDLADVSPLVISATVAIEDKTFFTNAGVDYEGIARTLYSSLSAGEETGGASTITQQVIKNIVLSDEERQYENRYQRKVKEIFLAQELNELYSKEEILELYLNEIFYGNLAYGIEAASQTYFGIPSKDLNVAQAALLAGLPQLPSKYNPINYLQRDEEGGSGVLPGVTLEDGWVSPAYQLPATIVPTKWRQIAVFRQMVDEGYVTEAQARTAIAQDLRFAPQEVPLNAPHFVFYVRNLLQERYGQQLVSGGGLEIHTTLDLDMQRMVQAKAAEHINGLDARNIHNAAVVVMQPNTGQILAMVGSIDYNAVETTKTPGQDGNVLDGQVNVATRERQPGSALKPFTYLAAMQQGMTPASLLWDVPTEFPLTNGEWYAPENYNSRWNGPVRIRTALANSLNMPAVKALKFAGVNYTLQFLDRVGIKSGLKRGDGFYGLSLTLGGGEVTLLELTTAYNTLANHGRYIPSTPILKITDGDGNVLEEYRPGRGEQVVDSGMVSIITDMMSDDEAREPIWGRNSKLQLSRPAAVKTGTSNDWRDAWTLGFTPFVTVGVWSGNNNNEPTSKVESLESGGIIWHNVMEELFDWIESDPQYRELFSAPFSGNEIPEEFTLAANVQRKSVCRLPGPFGGYDEELFTTDMIQTNARNAGNEDAELQGQIGGACDFYQRITVVRTGSDSGVRYCVPRSGDRYPPGMLTSVTVWNTPPTEPNVRVRYVWSSGSAGGGNFPLCSSRMFVRPTAAATNTPVPPTAVPAPVDGAVRMPNVIGLGENQARTVLQSLGVSAIYADYQSRERIPNIYDQYAPYTVISSQPGAGDWILPGTTVVLGIRGPDSQPAPQPDVPAQPQPQPQPQPEPPPQEPPPQDPQPRPIFPQPGTAVPLPGVRLPGQ
ncbi:MAG: penicillin-binding protein [Chloroflexaceae bacterium]